MNAFLQLKGTTAFFVQAMISFAISMTAVAVGIIYLPAPIWIRAFLALSVLYVITSSFTLAKCVRDRQEADAALNQMDGGMPVLPAPPPAAWR
jgi:hypothetical protein